MTNTYRREGNKDNTFTCNFINNFHILHNSKLSCLVYNRLTIKNIMYFICISACIYVICCAFTFYIQKIHAKYIWAVIQVRGCAYPLVKRLVILTV